MDEKRNHSNNPSELQPYELDTGKYTFDPKKDMIAPHSEEAMSGGNVSAMGAPMETSGPDDWDDADLSEFGEGIEDDADWNDDDLADFADGIDDNADWEPEYFKFDIDFKNEYIYAMGQDEAKEKGRKLHAELSEKYRGEMNFDEFGEDTFIDKRIWYAYLLTIDSIYSDFPALKRNNVLRMSFRAKNLYASYGKGYQYAEALCGPGHIEIDNRTTGPAGTYAASVLTRYRSQVDSGFWADLGSNTNLRLANSIIHEIGHSIENMLYKMTQAPEVSTPVSANLYYANIVWEKVRGIAERIAKEKGIEKYNFGEDTSVYGQVNSKEWFAETFTSMYGSRPTIGALALKEYLRENLK